MVNRGGPMQRILIIDDEREITNVLNDYFVAEGFDTLCCYDGADGLVKFEEFKPHLVILDIMLPYIEGIDILRSIRGKSDVPIIMVSAKKSDRDKIESLGLGADEYVEKPFSPRVLVAQTKALLRRSGQAIQKQDTQSRFLKIRNLEVNLEARAVKVEGGVVSLTPKEYDLLVYLMKNPNRVFSKEQLLDAIWGYEAYIDPNTITVHIRKLREKIERDSKNPELIKTVWGVGYQLVKE